MSGLRVFLCLGLLGAPLAAQDSPEQSRPNVLLVLTDDHSFPHLGVHDPAVKSPHLDRFAAEGMRFDRAFVTAPQCTPSRASLMTGRSPVALGMTRFSAPLPADAVTLPDLLQRAGYFVGAGGRYHHLDGPLRRSEETERLFARHELATFGRRMDHLQVNQKERHDANVLGAFLDKVPQGRPFFCWLNLHDPHHPWDARPVHDPAEVRVPSYLPDLPEVREDLARYLDEVTRADRIFHQFLAELERRELAKDTLVIFMGDNGMAFPHGKGSLHDPGLRVPLLVRWPGKVLPDSSCDALISGEDLAPTILEAAGLEVPPDMTGVSFLPALLGQPFPGRARVFAARGPHGYMPYTPFASTFDLSRCVRTQRFKLIYNCTPQQTYRPVDSWNRPYWNEMVARHERGELAPEFEQAYFAAERPVFELYDLHQDPGELHNLVGRPRWRKTEQTLKLALHEWMLREGDYLPLPLLR